MSDRRIKMDAPQNSDASSQNRTSGSLDAGVSRHAMIVKDGYRVPLIGVPPDAVLETCDCCGYEHPVAEMRWTGNQMLCKKCDG